MIDTIYKHKPDLYVYKKDAEYVQRYLDRIYTLATGYLTLYHTRAIVVRTNLRLPKGMKYDKNKGYMNGFIRSLRKKVATVVKRFNEEHGRYLDCTIKYAWCREYDKAKTRPHWHLIIFFNRNIFYKLGDFNDLDRDSLCTLIREAWCSVLNVSLEDHRGLVNISRLAVSELCLNSVNFLQQLKRVLTAGSYLAKVVSKIKGDGNRNFNASLLMEKGDKVALPYCLH